MRTPTIGGPAASETSLLSQGASPPVLPVLNFSEYEPCRTCYLEVYTIFRSESRGSVDYFWIGRPWKCILLLILKTLELYNIFRTENYGSEYYFRD